MSISRKTLTRVAITVTPAIVLLGLAAGPAAAAKPRQGSTPASCDVVDSVTGAVTQVPEGTRVGLFYCGSDGDWHFGTVILDHSKLTASPTTPTPTTPTPTKSATSRRTTGVAVR